MKVREVTAARAAEECKAPIDFHLIPPTSFGVPLRLMRHKNCMGVEDMLMILWNGERNELNETVAKTVMLLYVDSINLSNKEQTGRVFLKGDQIEEGFHINFYELIKIDPADYPKR
jgi:hypothetical protein